MRILMPFASMMRRLGSVAEAVAAATAGSFAAASGCASAAHPVPATAAAQATAAQSAVRCPISISFVSCSSIYVLLFDLGLALRQAGEEAEDRRVGFRRLLLLHPVAGVWDERHATQVC